MRPFVLLGAPRSRTFWLSRFLSSPGRPVMHEFTTDMRERDEIRRFFQRPGAAGADTALARIWRALGIENVNVVVIHRPATEIVASLRGLGLPTKGIEHYCLTLWGIPGHHINTSDLDNEVAANGLYQFCVGAPAPEGHWQAMHPQNLTVDLAALKHRVKSNAAGLRAIYEETPAWR